MRPLLAISTLLAFLAAPLPALTILVPGHADSLVQVLPGAMGNHYGTMTFDSGGSLYSTGGLTSNIWRRQPAGIFSIWATVPGVYSLGLVTVGNTLYAGDDGARLLAYDLTSPTPSAATVVSGVSSVHSLVAGCAGVPLAAATGVGVYNVDPVAGTFTLMGMGFYASGIACHISNTMILATHYAPDEIMAITPPSTVTIFRSGVGGDPDGLAVHPVTGDVYVACSASQEMWRLDPTGLSATLFGNGFNFDGGTWPTPLAFSPNGTELFWGSVDGAHSVHVINGFPAVPPPTTCQINAPAAAATVGDEVDVTFDAASLASPTLIATIERSTDGGSTFSPASPAAGSALTNPSAPMATPITGATFTWDSRADGIGTGVVQTTILRITVTGSGAPGQCQVSVEVDNTAICAGICGDCNLNAAGPDILDALQAAQIAAALIVPTPVQVGCCDVDASGLVSILDALRIAQAAAALPVTLTCL